MKFTRHSAAAALLSALFAAGLATTGANVAVAAEASAAPGPGAEQGGPQGGPPGEHGPEDGPPPGFGGHGPGAPGPGMPFGEGPMGGMPPLHGLKLSEAQQDKLFAIMHAAAPQRRDHEKAIRKAQDALREAGRADKFDDARASAAARDLGQAIAAATLLQARTEAQALAVLTPEQRTRLRERRAHGPMGPHDGPMGPHDGQHDDASGQKDGQREHAQGGPDHQ